MYSPRTTENPYLSFNLSFTLESNTLITYLHVYLPISPQKPQSEDLLGSKYVLYTSRQIACGLDIMLSLQTLRICDFLFTFCCYYPRKLVDITGGRWTLDRSVFQGIIFIIIFFCYIRNWNNCLVVEVHDLKCDIYYTIS